MSGMDELLAAFVRHAAECRDAQDALRMRVDEDANADAAGDLLRLSTELAHVLRRICTGLSAEAICKAFGAPGDWGETPIGAALARLYREGRR